MRGHRLHLVGVGEVDGGDLLVTVDDWKTPSVVVGRTATGAPIRPRPTKWIRLRKLMLPWSRTLRTWSSGP